MCVETTQVYEKIVKLSNRNMERQDIEICQIYLKLILQCNLRNRSRYLVYQPATQPVLQVLHIYSTRDYHYMYIKKYVVKCALKFKLNTVIFRIYLRLIRYKCSF